jgi:ADP-heptose:LPS heptosyltransferase
VPTATPPNAAPRSVAVVRALAGIGDMLCAVPALRSLRAGLPDAHVTLIGLPWAAEFVRRFPGYIDELAEFPGFPGIPEVPFSAEALPPFLAEMQARRFDLALQLHGSGFATNPFTLLLGATRTAGFHVPGQYRPSDAFIPYPEDVHELQRLTALTVSLGMPDTGEQLEWPVTAEDRRQLAESAGGIVPDAFAVVHPGTSDRGCPWPADRFAAVADGLAAEGLPVVLTGSAADAPLTSAVASAMRSPAIDLAGRTTLGAFGALLERARLVVCNCTGASHLADALGVPSVVVFTASDPLRWGPLDRDLHAAVRGPASVPAVLDVVVRQLQKGGARVA